MRIQRSNNPVEAALCLSRGLPNIESHFTPEALDQAHERHRGLGLQQVIIMAAAANGYEWGVGERIHQGNIEKILAFALPENRRGEIQASAGASTLGVSLSNLLSNVANKEIVTGYTQQDDGGMSEIAGVKSVPDFKQCASYRMLDNMEYEEVGPAGEIPHGTVSQESYTRQAKTYAKMFALTRTDIINDDLGAFDDLRQRVGGGGKMKLVDLFWTKFMTLITASFVTAGRGNYITGATTNLGTDGVGLQLALTKFLTMKSAAADGAKRIGGRPVMLLVPPELSFNADRLYVSENLVGDGGNGTTPGANTVPSANIHARKYKPVVCPWLSDPAFANNSTTGWGLLRAKEQLPAVVISYLNGQDQPTVESSEADFDTLGVQFRGFHDFGVDFAEYLALVWSKGAA